MRWDEMKAIAEARTSGAWGNACFMRNKSRWIYEINSLRDADFIAMASAKWAAIEKTIDSVNALKERMFPAYIALIDMGANPPEEWKDVFSSLEELNK